MRVAVIRFRRRYLQVETALEFYGNAVNTRTSPRLAGLLTACDTMAVASMRPVLEPLGRPVPPILTYVDKGLGASILRAGPAPLGRRVGQPGGGAEDHAPEPLPADRARARVRPPGRAHRRLERGARRAAAARARVRSSSGARGRRGPAGRRRSPPTRTRSSHTGYGSVAALHDVVVRRADGVPARRRAIRTRSRICACCSACRCACASSAPGRGTTSAARGCGRTRSRRRRRDTRALAERSLPLLPRIAELCLLTPMRAFGGRPIVALVDPLRVRPDALEQLEREAGGALTTSSYWIREGGAAAAGADELPLGDAAGAVARDREAIRELDAAPRHAVGGRGVNGERRGGRGECSDYDEIAARDGGGAGGARARGARGRAPTSASVNAQER